MYFESLEELTPMNESICRTNTERFWNISAEIDEVLNQAPPDGSEPHEQGGCEYPASCGL